MNVSTGYADVDTLMKHARKLEQAGRKEDAELTYAAAAEIARMRGELSEAVAPILKAADLADGSSIWPDEKVWGLRGVPLGSLRRLAELQSRLSSVSATRENAEPGTPPRQEQ